METWLRSYLVQLVPDTLRSTLHEDELARGCKLAVGVVVERLVGLCLARRARQQLGLLEALHVCFVHASCATSKILNRAEIKLRSFPLSFGAKGL
jgi:hypothetical protein